MTCCCRLFRRHYHRRGTGLVLAGGCTTGGTDMLAAFSIRAKFPHYSVAQIMQLLDGLIVAAGATLHLHPDGTVCFDRYFLYGKSGRWPDREGNEIFQAGLYYFR